MARTLKVRSTLAGSRLSGSRTWTSTLMLLVESRRASRTGPDGVLVRLADQDRRAWDQRLIQEGQALVRQCLRLNRPGPYQIQAAINAVHSDAATAAETDWSQ